jgi:hypothetical protein
MGLLSAGGVVGWIVDEMRGNLALRAQYFFNPADEVAYRAALEWADDAGRAIA